MGRSRDLSNLAGAGAVGTTNIADNAVTTAKIAAGAVITADIADANVTGAKLENSGVTAGSYGSSSAIPVVTVDAKGRVTSATTAALSSSAPTTAQVLSATAGASAGAVGTYALMGVNGGPIDTGVTVAGSSLWFAATNGQAGSPTPAGTWRCMGYAPAYGNTVYLRIS
jgi:hypothetical protein